MPARDPTNCVGHGEYGQTEGERDAEPANPDIRIARGENGAAAAAKHEPEGAEKFGD